MLTTVPCIVSFLVNTGGRDGSLAAPTFRVCSRYSVLVQKVHVLDVFNLQVKFGYRIPRTLA